MTDNGVVKCWGLNDDGQAGQGHRDPLGDDELLRSFNSVDLLGETAKEVHTNGKQTYVLFNNGAVHGWGANESFDLGLTHNESIGGDEPPFFASVATKVELGGKAVRLVVGGNFACALMETATISCWGNSDQGQLGQGSTARIGDDEAPMNVPVIDLGRPVVDLSAGAAHACAVLDDATMRCWGANDRGQLGLGNTLNLGDDEPPLAVDALDLGAPITKVVAGAHHTCALLNTGAVRCWGANDFGQLGLATNDVIGDDERPIDVNEVNVGSPAVDLAAGSAHTCAVLNNGDLRCWGSGASGRLGLGHTETIGDDEVPSIAGAVDLGAYTVEAIFIGAMSSSTCARFDDGQLRCWGANDKGQLGQGHIMDLCDDPGEIAGDLPIMILLDDD